MQKTNKKLRISLVVTALSAAIIVGSILAYMSTGDIAKNEFTVGDVAVEITETNWDALSSIHIYPNQEIDKNPAVKNIGTNNAYIFIKVSIPMVNGTVVNDDEKSKNTGNKIEQITENSSIVDGTTESGIIDVYDFTVNSGWILLEETKDFDDTTNTGTHTYLYAYATDSKMTIIEPEKSTETLFDTVTFKNFVEGQFDNGSSNKTYDEDTSGIHTFNVNQDINIETYAIQDKWITDEQNNAADSGTSKPQTVWSIVKNGVNIN